MPSPSSLEHDRDEADHTHADPGPEPSDPGTSASKRHQQLEACSEAAKRCVDAVSANMENRCLITNCLPKYAVEHAHLLPRATADSDLTQLEFSWSLRWGTLNVDTHFNAFPLRRDLHALFDKGWLVLLPEEDIVQKYANGGKPDFNGDRTNNVRYNYTLIPSTEMDGFQLNRLQFPVQPGEGQGHMSLLYPFAGFPVLQSHVHPCYAICHAGRFRRHQHNFSPGTSHDLYVRLTTVIATYSDWMDAELDDEFLKNPGCPTDRYDRIGDDETHPNRADDAGFRRSDRLQNENNKQGSPSEERGGKRRQCSDNQREAGDCRGDTSHEDCRGLRALLKAEISYPHIYKQKEEFVLDWVIGQTFVGVDPLVPQKSHEESQTYDVIIESASGHAPMGSFEERSLVDFDDWIEDWIVLDTSLATI